VDHERHVAGAQEFGEERRAAGAVDVVVAEDRDRLPALDGIGEARGRGFHVAQLVRIRHEVAEAGAKEARHLVHGNAAAGEHAGEHVRQPMRLRDRGRDRGAQRVAALVPRPAKRRAGDAEKRARRGKGKRFGHRPSLAGTARGNHGPAVDGIAAGRV
jgi:hypothetical protein